MSWVKVTQRMVDTPKVAAPIPLCAHGDTEDNPKPIPSINKIKDRAAATAAPATMALHDTALASACVLSDGTPDSVRTIPNSSAEATSGSVIMNLQRFTLGDYRDAYRRICSL